MMRRPVVITLLLIVVGFSLLQAGQEAPKAPKLVFFGMQVEGHGPGGRYTNLYLVMGEDHHSAAVLADDEIILVDTKSKPGWGKPISDVLATISEQQVTTLINTNPHQGVSNGEFPKVVDIIAQERTKTRMATLAGANATALPNKTFKDKLSLTVKTTGANDGANRIDLFYFGPGYTDGDTVVVFPQYNTVFLGELYPGKFVPLIDRANGGSALRLPDTLEKALSTLKTYIPFQAVIAVRQAPPLVTTAMLTSWGNLRNFEEYVAFVRALVGACRTAHDAKKSVDEAVAGFSLPERFKGYSLDGLRPFVQAVYDELR
jgi:hypothetical protein